MELQTSWPVEMPLYRPSLCTVAGYIELCVDPIISCLIHTPNFVHDRKGIIQMDRVRGSLIINHLFSWEVKEKCMCNTVGALLRNTFAGASQSIVVSPCASVIFAKF